MKNRPWSRRVFDEDEHKEDELDQEANYPATYSVSVKSLLSVLRFLKQKIFRRNADSSTHPRDEQEKSEEAKDS